MRKEIGVHGHRVAIYIRWSTEDQGQGTTLEVQREACTAYVVSQGWSVSDELLFIDDGCSGGSMDRPALMALRKQVKAGAVDCVVVCKLDRLSRSVVDLVKLVLEEWDGHCFVKSAREPIDTMTQIGKMFFYQLASFAEWERSVIRERTFSGKLRRARQGLNPGITAAYGYRLGRESQLVTHPGEAAVVRLIFKLYLSGLGCVQIARRLWRLGHPSAKGKEWSEAQISRMLSNPIYIGRLVYGKQVTVRGKRVKSDKPLVITDGAAPAIIDPTIFEQVQQVKATRPQVGRRGSTGRTLGSRSLLTGLLRCHCGHAYCASGGGGHRVRYRYYYCGGAQSKGALFCDSGRVHQDVLDQVVVMALLSHFTQADILQRLLSRIRGELEQGLEESRAALKATSREIAKVIQRGSRLKRLLLEGELPRGEFPVLNGEMMRHHDLLRVRAAQQQDSVNQAQLSLSSSHWLAEQLERIDPWDVLGIHERKQLVRHFVGEVVSYRDKQTHHIQCSIQWRSADSTHGPGSGSSLQRNSP